MTVLLLAKHLDAGGITSYLLTLCRGYIQSGVQVHVVAYDGNMKSQFVAAGACVHLWDLNVKSELHPQVYAHIPFINRLVRKHAVDVMHAHTRVTQVLAAWVHRFTGVPYCSTCHGFFKKRLGRRIAGCWGEKVIAISPAVAEHLRHDFHVPEARIVLISSGISLENFELPDEPSRIRVRETRGLRGVIIGMIARLSDVKGQDILIQALPDVLKHVPEARVLLVGQGKWKNTLVQLVENLQLQEKVEFVPTVNQTADYLSLMDIFVMPSRQEGLGLAALEAYACGVPVIASRVGGLPHLVDHEQTGLLVEPEDPAALAGAVVTLAKDPLRCREMGRRGRRKVEELFTADKMVKKTLAVYRGLRRRSDAEHSGD